MKRRDYLFSNRSLLLFALWIVVALTACSDGETIPEPVKPDEPTEETPTLPNNTEMADNVKVLTEKFALNIEKVAEGQLLFSVQTPKEQLPKPEDILLNYTPNSKFKSGFLGKVTKVETTDKGIKVQTEAVGLDKVFKTLSIDTTFNVMDKIEKIVDSRGKSIAFIKDTIHTRSEVKNSLSFNVEYNHNFSGVKMDIKGTVKLALDTHIQHKIDNFSVKEFGINLTPNFSASLTNSVSVSREYKDSILLGSFYSLPITVGPVVITPVFDIYMNFGIKGELSLNIDFVYSKTLSTCSLLYKEEKWTYTQKPNTPEDKKSPFPFEGNVTLKGEYSTGPSIIGDFLFYQGLMYVGLGTKAMITASSEMQIDFTKPISPEMYAKYKTIPLKEEVSISAIFHLGSRLFEFLKGEQSLEVELFTATIYDGSFFPSLAKPELKATKGNIVTYPYPTEAPLPARYGVEVVNEQKEVIKTEFANNNSVYTNEVEGNAEFSIADLPKGKYTARPLIEYCNTKVYSNEEKEFELNYSIREVLVGIYKNNGGQNWAHQKNWCSDLPITEWEGVSIVEDGGYYYFGFIDKNNLTGVLSIVNCDESIFISKSESLEGLYIKNCPNLIMNPIVYNFPNLKTIFLDNIKINDYRNENSRVSSLNFSNMPLIENIHVQNCKGKILWFEVYRCPKLKTVICEHLVFDKDTYNSPSPEKETQILISCCDELNEIRCNYNSFVYRLAIADNKKLKDVIAIENYPVTINIADCQIENFSYNNPNIDRPTFFFESNIIKNLHLVGVDFGNQQGDYGLKRVNGLVSCYAENCGGNYDYGWDFSRQENLKSIELNECYGELNLSECVQLEKIACKKSLKLTTLNIIGLPMLKYVDCSDCSSLVDFSFDNRINNMYVNCKNNYKLKKMIPNFVDESAHFSHDIRYSYHIDNETERVIVTDHGYGWWYSGEPGNGQHGRRE